MIFVCYSLTLFLRKNMNAVRQASEDELSDEKEIKLL